MEAHNIKDFWYGRINKHPEDCTREEIFRIAEDYGKHLLKSKLPTEEENPCTHENVTYRKLQCSCCEDCGQVVEIMD